MKLINQSVELLSQLDNSSLKLIELAGRVCYKSEGNITDDSCKIFVKKLIKRSHESVLEHEKITVRIITSRAIANELVRHRIASFSQESTRYVNYKDGVEFIIPVWFNGNDLMCNNKLLQALDGIEWTYQSMIKAGMQPQDAREILPLCTKTELVMTANIREWRHILKERLAPAAHPQMRELMKIVIELFRSKVDILFDDINHLQA